jgi:polyketide biosynthesis enoyl-CoA hydratase PksI
MTAGPEDTAAREGSPGAVMLGSAVELCETDAGVVQITMRDRASKNAFTPALIGGLLDAFRLVAANTDWKVVVLTGYDSYFASGGTQSGLLSLQEGQGTFADVNLYGLALDCEIPVIAAMQGHGIGGGFVMGLYADFVILGRESVYTTNFMKYGFTPGMGATYILPRKLGLSLAHEMLLGAETFRGAALEKRGIAFPVLPRADVLRHARELARGVAMKPRKSLVTLKRHLVTPLRNELPAVIDQELAMHAETFHDPEIKERISKLFGR